MCGKNFSIYGVQIPRKCIESMHFLLMPQFSIQNSRQNFLKICFPQGERVGEKYDLLYPNSVKKYEDDLR